MLSYLFRIPACSPQALLFILASGGLGIGFGLWCHSFEYWAHIGRTNDELIVPHGMDVDFDGVEPELR